MKHLKITNVFVLGAFIAIGFLSFQLSHARSEASKYREAARAAGIMAENQLALAADQMVIAGQLRDRAVQAEVARDSLAGALEERPVIETVVRVEVPAETVEAEPLIADSVIQAHFEDEWLTADIEIRTVDVTATLDYQIAPISIRIGARCGRLDPVTGVRPAIITIDRVDPAPREGMEIVVSGSTISPDVCNPVVVVPSESRGFDLKSAGLGALGVLGVLLLGR